MLALNVAHARICTQNCKPSLIVFNRTAPFACRLCSAFPNPETWRTRSSMRLDALAGLLFVRFRSAFRFYVRFQILRPIRFLPEPGSNPISTTVTMLNKILFGLLKFYFTLNTGRKKTFQSTILLQSHGQATFLAPNTVVISHPIGSLQYFTSHSDTKKKSVFSSFLKTCKVMSFYFTLLYFILLYFTLS